MTKKRTSIIKKYFKPIFIILIVSSILAAGILLFNVSSFINQDGDSVVNSNEYYQLKGSPTQLQKDLFKELTKQVELKQAYDLVLVELLVKNFVADYYTWSNKQGPYDVGGSNFIYGMENLNFFRTSRRYFYSNMSNYLSSGLEISDLPEVETITTRPADFAVGFDYYGDNLIAFYCEVDWTYKVNDKVDLSIFPTYAAFTITITEEGRYEIVRFY